MFFYVFHGQMADVLAVNHVDHVLANVLRMVADALERASNPQHIQRPANGARIFHHERDALALDGFELFGMGYSWGGFESLCLPIHPERIRTAVNWNALGDMFRIHVGFEDIEDLKTDLQAGLERYRAANTWYDPATGRSTAPG